eukprot:scaffold39090_cov144-Skeletonema_marinoi.AAC.6
MKPIEQVGSYTSPYSESCYCTRAFRTLPAELSLRRFRWTADYREDHRYPIERPTASDFGLWRTALFTVFSTTSILYRPLGKYLRHPPLPHEWLYSSSDDLLFRRSSNTSSSSVAIYVKSPSASVSNCNTVQFTFSFSCTASDPPVTNHFASVTSLTDSSVTVHSFAPVPSPPTVLSLQE